MSPMPPPWPPGIGAAFFSSGSSLTRASVVSMRAAIEPAFCSAVRTTFVGPLLHPCATQELLNAGFPISGLSFVMSNRDDTDHGRVIKVNN